jgi:CRP-like cAMP-binding protein
MLEKLIERVREQESDLIKHSGIFNEIKVPSKTELVKEGDNIKFIYFVKKGCLRLWFNNQGNDITYQFFFENQVVSGFVDGDKSMFTLESIEPSTIILLKVSDFEILLNEIPGLKDEYLDYVTQRLAYYSRLFLSRIRDSPAERYQLLLKENPAVVARVPQHYIATFLGITPVSLSRIRNRKFTG